MLQMSKLMLNSEFRDASKNMIEEFQKAGLDPTDKVRNIPCLARNYCKQHLNF